MGEIIFTREQGGIPKTLPGQDHYTGLIMYADLDEGAYFENGYVDTVLTVSSLKTAENAGLTANSTQDRVQVIHYIISEIFRINPSCKLYLLVTHKYDLMAAGIILQDYANGTIRTMGFWADDIKTSNYIAECINLSAYLRDRGTPITMLCPLYKAEIIDYEAIRQPGWQDLSVVISQNREDVCDDLYRNHGYFISDIGIFLGLVSKAKVHESIAWRLKFNTGINKPGFIDVPYEEVDKGLLEDLTNMGYLFLEKENGIGGAYANDSQTMDLATSDYATIEANRTMDKAERGIRIYLTPYKNAPVYVDAKTGQLRADMVKFFEKLAGTQIENMTKAGELSGYKVTVDPEQNVLATSELEFIIENVPVGVLRKMNVKLKFTTNL